MIDKLNCLHHNLLWSSVLWCGVVCRVCVDDHFVRRPKIGTKKLLKIWGGLLLLYKKREWCVVYTHHHRVQRVLLYIILLLWILYLLLGCFSTNLKAFIGLYFFCTTVLFWLLPSYCCTSWRRNNCTLSGKKSIKTRL